MSLPVVAPGEQVIEMMIPASKVGLIIGKLNTAWPLLSAGTCIVRSMMPFSGILHLHVELPTDISYF